MDKLKTCKPYRMRGPYKVTPDEFIKVWTAGAVGPCRTCGRHYGAGVGIYFSDFKQRAYPSTLTDYDTNLAHMDAAYQAIDMAKDDGETLIEINTDSQYVVDILSSYENLVNPVMTILVNKISTEENWNAYELAYYGIHDAENIMNDH